MNDTYADGRLLAHRDEAVVTIELNQPARRNALSAAMWQALPVIAADMQRAPDVRVVRFRGVGGEAFSAGADISEFERVYADRDSTDAYNQAVRAGQAAIRNLPLPTIAEISGACVGGGLGLALACDLRFAADDARFAITPARLGLAYSFDDTRQLVEKVGPARAKDILFSGRLLPAAEALAIGLIDRMEPPQDLSASVDAYCALLRQSSSASIAVLKSTINAIAGGATEAPAPLAADFDALFDGPHFKEGRRAFLAKRRPRFD